MEFKVYNTLLKPLIWAAFFTSMVTNASNSAWPGNWIAYEEEAVPQYASELEDVEWIWSPFVQRLNPSKMTRDEVCFFQKKVSIGDVKALQSAILYITADKQYTLYLNGQEFASNNHWRTIEKLDLTPHLKTGENLLAIQVDVVMDQYENLRGGTGVPAGLIAKLKLNERSQRPQTLVTDNSWLTSKTELDGWFQGSANTSDWQPAQSSGLSGVEDWSQSDLYSNRWYCYRKNITIESKAQPLIARIAVDSKYWLWINGKLALFEGGAKRGPDPHNTYYDTVDLTDHLQTGENSLAILAWYWGRDGFSHKDSGAHGLYFDLKAGDQWLVSDDTWKVRIHPAFKASGPPWPNYRLPEYNVHYDAREDIGGWYLPDYNFSDWNRAVVLGSPPDAPWNQLVDRMIPQWKDTGLINYENPPQLPLVSNGKMIEIALPHNAHVTPWFKIKAQAGQLIDLRMDNYQGGSEQSIRSEYTTRGGIQSFETPAWMSGHKVQYTFPQGIEVLDLKYRDTSFDAPITGSFHCDNPQLNELWQRSLRTLLVCMRDTYYDCPDRERAQWWGDGVIEVGQTFYALDRISDTLSKKGILELVNWQREDHTLFSPIPGNWNAELPGQMLMTIGRSGMWTYYFHSGDLETIRRAYPHLRPYLELWEMDSDGLVGNRQGDWYWGDWGTNKDTRMLDNLYYYFALDGVNRMAKVTGNDQDCSFYEQRMASIKENFDRVFWQGDHYRSPEHTGETDDRPHGLAVVAGIADPANYDAIATFLESNFQASPYVEKYILEALIKMGRTQQALDRMLDRYKTHLAEPITTLFEGWGIGSEGFGGGTINHSWSGGPLTLMSQYVAGIEPIEVGYKRFRITPHLGDLKDVEATVPSAIGRISHSIQASDAGIDQKIAIPQGAVAEVGIPVENKTKLKVLKINWKPVFERDKFKDLGKIKFLERNQNYILYEFPAGSYEIEARW